MDKFSAWHEAARGGPLSEATVRTYAGDVARFLVALRGASLSTVDAHFVAGFISRLKPSLQRRMVSALSDFWAFALAEKWVNNDVIRGLKFKRSKYALERQMNFFDVLVDGGVDESLIKHVTWAAFVEPLLAREQRKLLVAGKTVNISPMAWRRLHVEFRSLAASTNLRVLLMKRIATSRGSARSHAA